LIARDLQGLVDRGGAAQTVGKEALVLVRQLFTAWHRYRDGTLDRAGLQAAMQPVQDAFATLLDAGAQSPDRKVVGLCVALDRLWPALWTFVDEDGVEPTGGPLGDRRRTGAAAGCPVAQGLVRHAV
jgi:hypothetical protein